MLSFKYCVNVFCCECVVQKRRKNTKSSSKYKVFKIYKKRVVNVKFDVTFVTKMDFLMMLFELNISHILTDTRTNKLIEEFKGDQVKLEVSDDVSC